eukprot:jgi/Mesen1/3122/ME000184S02193
MVTDGQASKSRWKSKEFIFYYLYVATFYAILARRSVLFSADYSGSQWRPWLRGLQQGWMPNTLIDLSDSQWQNFRGGLSLLSIVMGGMAGLAIILRTSMRGQGQLMAYFWLTASLSYVSYLHGACVAFILAIAAANYALVKSRQHLTFLDSHRGVFRWQICFNLGARQEVQPVQRGEALLSPAPGGGSSSRQLLARQLPGVLVYGVRWAACFLLMELLCHTCYFFALANSGLWQQLAPVDVCILAYGVLNLMWLKFLLIWRYFRFWALAAGVEAPENMQRCVNNSYDLEGFWKGWHASYNRWLVRYMYIPLGGSKWRALNVWAIFTFVALWHDLEWKLLWWAWITCLLCTPELAAKALMRSPRMKAFRESWAYREVCAVAGAANITALMMVNLIGFVVGPSGARVFLSKFLQRQNIGLLLAIEFSLYVGTKLMLELRAGEERRTSKRRAITELQQEQSARSQLLSIDAESTHFENTSKRK